MPVVYQPPGEPATPTGRLRASVRAAPDTVSPTKLVPGEVHLWTVALSETVPDGAALHGVLSADELARFERFGFPRAKAQFAKTRRALRTVLAGYLGCRPGELQFGYSIDGKPELVGADGPTFNVSHTDGLAVIAVTNSTVGVDVETGRPPATADALVERFFAPVEREQYRSLPLALQPSAFLRGWTCKEAMLKGVGCGARGLEGCVVDIDPHVPPRVVSLAGPVAACGSVWALGWWQPSEGVAATVAVQGGREVIFV